MKVTIGLIGNQNSGKTTLFNCLTGSNQHVGNFPGVTVAKKTGILKFSKDVEVVDLPGIYSLSPYTPEEIITQKFLLDSRPDVIINIVDATNIERNLYLSLQLLTLGIPMVIALNMIDELEKSKTYIDIDSLSKLIETPIVCISAIKETGIGSLIDCALSLKASPCTSKQIIYSDINILKIADTISLIISDKAKNTDTPLFFAVSKLLEDDDFIKKRLSLDNQESEKIFSAIKKMEHSLALDCEAALANMRYNFIENVCQKCVKKHVLSTKAQLRSLKIDSILTHKFFAIPLFICIMMSIFYLTFNVIGKGLSDMLTEKIDSLSAMTSAYLSRQNISAPLQSLVVDGIFVGVGSVLSFLPIILTLFFMLSILEDSGYMARISFIMDYPLQKIGLSGHSFVPALIGFGCSVPAIMSTRTLKERRDKMLTIMLIPFISCSAKLPIYAMFSAAFFKKQAALVMIGLYFFGIIMGLLSTLMLKNTAFEKENAPFLMELPPYRLPAFKNVVLLMWEKTKAFITKAFTIIFISTIIIWFLQNFNWRLALVDIKAHSILASLAGFLTPVFSPLGFGRWEAVAALVTGLSAKETVISTLMLVGGGKISDSDMILTAMFTPLQAVSFLIFTLLYMPCIATFAAMRHELGGYKKAGFVMLYQTAFAWIVSFVFYSFGLLFI